MYVHVCFQVAINTLCKRSNESIPYPKEEIPPPSLSSYFIIGATMMNTHTTCIADAVIMDCDQPPPHTQWKGLSVGGA